MLVNTAPASFALAIVIPIPPATATPISPREAAIPSIPSLPISLDTKSPMKAPSFVITGKAVVYQGMMNFLRNITIIGLNRKPMKSPIGLNISIILKFNNFNTCCNIGEELISTLETFLVNASNPTTPVAIIPNFAKFFPILALLPPAPEEPPPLIPPIDLPVNRAARRFSSFLISESSILTFRIYCSAMTIYILMVDI